MSVEARIVSDFAGFVSLEAAWTEAAQREVGVCPTVLPAWSYGLMARQQAGRSFHVLVLQKDGGLALCMAYLVERRGSCVRIRAASEITPLFCPAPSTGLFDRTLEVLHATYGAHSLLLDHVEPERPETAGLLEAAGRRYAAVETRREEFNIVVDLSLGWAAVRAGLSANSREALRRARARIDRLGLRAAYRTAKAPSEVGNIFAAVLAVDANSWKYERGGAMAVCANEHTQFFFALQKFAASGQARVYLLELDGRAAAFILAIVIGERAYMAIWSYDDAFSACSPGRLIMERALSDLAAEGVRLVDFWGRPDAFKVSWSRAVVTRSSYTFHPSGAIGPVLRGVLRAVSPLQTVLIGSAERYRLRRDAGGLVDRLLEPIKRAVIRRRRLSEAEALWLQPVDRASSEGTTCREAQECDKVRLPMSPFQLETWRVFEQCGAPVACARVELWRDGTLFVERLWFVRPGPEIASACARALLKAFPKARRLAEPRAETALSSTGGFRGEILRARRGT